MWGLVRLGKVNFNTLNFLKPYFSSCTASGNDRVWRLRQSFGRDLLFINHRHLDSQTRSLNDAIKQHLEDYHFALNYISLNQRRKIDQREPIYAQVMFPFQYAYTSAKGLCMLYKVNSNSNHCLFSELPSASVRVRQTWTAAAAHPLELELWRCRTFKFARCFLPAQTRVWNDLPYTVFDTGTIDWFKGAVNRWLLPSLCFSRGVGVCGVA